MEHSLTSLIHVKLISNWWSQLDIYGLSIELERYFTLIPSALGQSVPDDTYSVLITSGIGQTSRQTSFGILQTYKFRGTRSKDTAQTNGNPYSVGVSQKRSLLRPSSPLQRRRIAISGRALSLVRQKKPKVCRSPAYSSVDDVGLVDS